MIGLQLVYDCNVRHGIHMLDKRDRRLYFVLFLFLNVGCYDNRVLLSKVCALLYSIHIC
jgi:hypothetical protein